VSRLEIFFQKGRRHHQRLARIVEPGRVRGIDRELARGLDIDAGEIANGIVVFRIAQPPRKHDARIAGVPLHLPLAQIGEPGNDFTPLLRRRPRLRLLGRHLLGLEPVNQQIQMGDVLRHRRFGRINAQVELRIRRSRAMAFEAMLLQKRFDRAGKAVLRLSRSAFGLESAAIDRRRNQE